MRPGFHIAAGVAILTGVQARLAAILLTSCTRPSPRWYTCQHPADPSRHFFWTENAVNLALTGVALGRGGLAARRPGSRG